MLDLPGAILGTILGARTRRTAERDNAKSHVAQLLSADATHFFTCEQIKRKREEL